MYPYRNLKVYPVRQMLHYIPEKIKFEYIELQEIYFTIIK
jgi:hypothetical protein